MRRPSTAIFAIFLLSGAAGLIYEIAWSRQLVLVFGNTTQAVSAILTGFFGGLAVGAAVGGRIADRVRSPLRMYGWLELILVVVVLATPVSFGLIHELYRGIYPSLETAPGLLAVVRLVLAVLALAPATILMGATFPSLTRHLARQAALSWAFGRLYAMNTIGAIVGTIAAGFFLIELLGLSGALLAGAACSLVAGLAAIWLARGDRGAPDAEVVDPVAGNERAGEPMSVWSRRVRLALVIAFVSGLTSLGYQVTWVRLLASGTGNTTYVFTMILAIFLIGIALGAEIFNIVRPRLKDPLRLLAIAQLVVAALAIAGLVAVISRPAILEVQPLDMALRSLLGSTLIVVLPVTIVLGLAFPTASILLRDERGQAGGESGSLLAVNTAGAILGSLLIPFILMPLVGSPMVIVLLATANLAMGIGLALVVSPRRPAAFVAAGLVVVLIAVSVLRPGTIVQPTEARIRALEGVLFASAEDEIASVQAGQVRFTPELWVAGTSMTLLTVDAKLMPILPLAARPDAERALVVAFGMGTSFRTALIAGLRTDVIELVPSVPDMFGFYYPDAADVLADPRGRVIITDGRNHLELTTERFDIIVTDPPPPIESSGAAVISSLEYYQAGHGHLVDGGVMMQWVPFGSPEAEFKEHIRTFAAVFPHVTIIRGPGGYGAYMLGSDDPLDVGDDAIRVVLARPGVLDDISSAYDSPADTVEGWLAAIDDHRWLDGDAVRAYAGHGPLITDDRPRPEYFLLRRFGAGTLP